MKLEYLHDLTEGGKYPFADPVHLIRLFSFDKNEAEKLMSIIESCMVINRESLDVSDLAFVEPVNCSLLFEISPADLGIAFSSENNFICRLSIKSYRKMIGYIKFFAVDDRNGYNWLYESEEGNIDLLFSPGGTW